MKMMQIMTIASVAISVPVGVYWMANRRMYKQLDERLRAVRDYPLEREFGRLLRKKHPDWDEAKHAAAWSALRQYFYACLIERVENKKVALDMPSSIADEAWHVMVKDSIQYDKWCTSVLGFKLEHKEKEHKKELLHDFALGSKRFSPGVHRLWNVMQEHKDKKLDDKPLFASAAYAVPLIFALDASMGGTWQYMPAHLQTLQQNPQRASDSGSGSSCSGFIGAGCGGKGSASEGSAGYSDGGGSSCSGSSCGGGGCGG